MTFRRTVRRRAVDPAGTPAGPDEQRLPRRRDGGFSIVEIVITISLMGVVIAPILSAVAISIKASRVSVTAAEVETMLVNAVDRVNRAPREGDYECDLSTLVENAMLTHQWPASSATVGHEYLDQSSGDWLTDPGGTACPGGILPNGLVQRITVTVTSPNGDVSRTLQVVRGGGESDV